MNIPTDKRAKRILNLIEFVYNTGNKESDLWECIVDIQHACLQSGIPFGKVFDVAVATFQSDCPRKEQLSIVAERWFNQSDLQGKELLSSKPFISNTRDQLIKECQVFEGHAHAKNVDLIVTFKPNSLIIQNAVFHYAVLDVTIVIEDSVNFT